MALDPAPHPALDIARAQEGRAFAFGVQPRVALLAAAHANHDPKACAEESDAERLPQLLGAEAGRRLLFDQPLH